MSKFNGGQLSVQIGVVGSLIGSVVIALASYFSAITAQKVQATELEGKIELIKSSSEQTNNQQDKDIAKLNENIMTVNDNISKLLIIQGVSPKQIKP